MSLTVTDPESHTHFPFVDAATVSLNMAVAMGIFTTSLLHVHDAVNGQRSRTFSAVESEVPALAAAVTAIDPKSTSPVHMKSGVREVLGEQTVLLIT